MIKFIKDNWIMLSLVLLLVMAETLHLFFREVPFKFYQESGKQIFYNSPIYHLINQFGLINFIPAIFIFMLTPKVKKASRCIGIGIIVWNTKELLEEIFYILKLDYDVFNPFNVNGSMWGQIAFILGVILLSGYGFKKWKY